MLDAGCSILDNRLIFKILSSIQYPVSSINKLTGKKFLRKQKLADPKNSIWKAIVAERKPSIPVIFPSSVEMTTEGVHGFG